MFRSICKNSFIVICFLIVTKILLENVRWRNRREIFFGRWKYSYDEEKIVEVRRSKFGEITISESSRLRMIRFDRSGTEGVIHLDETEIILFDYIRLELLCFFFFHRIERILIVGLGAGILPRIFHRISPETSIDVVEINLEMIELAEKYFFFRSNEKIRVFNEDGRNFLRRAESKSYDLIFLDAFIVNGEIPRSLRTLQCLKDIQTILKPNGILFSNFVDENICSDRETYQRANFALIFRISIELNNIFISFLNRTKLGDRKQIQKRAEQLEATRKLVDFDWRQISRFLLEPNEDRWNRSASIFIDEQNQD